MKCMIQQKACIYAEKPAFAVSGSSMTSIQGIIHIGN